MALAVFAVIVMPFIFFAVVAVMIIVMMIIMFALMLMLLFAAMPAMIIVMVTFTRHNLHCLTISLTADHSTGRPANCAT